MRFLPAIAVVFLAKSPSATATASGASNCASCVAQGNLWWADIGHCEDGCGMDGCGASVCAKDLDTCADCLGGSGTPGRPSPGQRANASNHVWMRRPTLRATQPSRISILAGDTSPPSAPPSAPPSQCTATSRRAPSASRMGPAPGPREVATTAARRTTSRWIHRASRARSTLPRRPVPPTRRGSA